MSWNSLRLVEVTLTPEASALDAGDVAVAITEIPNALRDKDQACMLRSLSLVDPSDQKAELKFYFFSSTVAFGTLDAAPGLSDADALKFLGRVTVAAADYEDLGGVAVAVKSGLDFILKGASGSASIFVAATATATPTFGANALTLRLGIES